MSDTWFVVRAADHHGCPGSVLESSQFEGGLKWPLTGGPNIKGLQGLQEKGLQSRSATASLHKKNYQCMKEERKLIVFLAQKSSHIVEACGRG